MEVFKEILATIAVLAIGVPLVLILAGLAVNIIRIMGTFTDELQGYISCKIRKEIRGKDKSSAEYWNPWNW